MNEVDHELEGFNPQQNPSQIARRADAQRKLIFSHKGGKMIFVLAIMDLIVTFSFAVLPDKRAEDAMIGSTIYNNRFAGIMLAQQITAWVSFVVSIAVVSSRSRGRVPRASLAQDSDVDATRRFFATGSIDGWMARARGGEGLIDRS